jgi:hypothetical protein
LVSCYIQTCSRGLYSYNGRCSTLLHCIWINLMWHFLRVCTYWPAFIACKHEISPALSRPLSSSLMYSSIISYFHCVAPLSLLFFFFQYLLMFMNFRWILFSNANAYIYKQGLFKSATI